MFLALVQLLRDLLIKRGSYGHHNKYVQWFLNKVLFTKDSKWARFLGYSLLTPDLKGEQDISSL